MKQIKTITAQLGQVEKFDERVNSALANGWRLVCRKVLPPYEIAGNEYYRMLYAELERDDYVPLLAGCDNCAHAVNGCASDSLHSICRHCKQCEHWTPRLEKGERR